MRHRDDDLSPFREDPVVQALTAPGTETELADEAAAVAAFHGAVTPKPNRRSAARAATTGVAAVVVLAVSGGAAAAYTSNLPDSWQAKLHNDLPSLHFPKPEAKPKSLVQSPPQAPVVPPPPAPATPTPPLRPTPTRHTTPTTLLTTPAAAPTGSPTVPVVVAPPSSPPPAPTSPPTQAPAVSGHQLAITGVSPANRVVVGSDVSVSGRLTAADGTAVANRRVALVERLVGVRGSHRVGVPVRTSASGEVTLSVPDLEHNALLVLRTGRHIRSSRVRVAVVPIISLTVAPTASGATSTTVTVSVRGAQPGDVVGIRQAGGQTQRGTLSSSLSATFTVPVSQSQTIHYRAFVPRTSAHAAHSLAFYTPASG